LRWIRVKNCSNIFPVRKWIKPKIIPKLIIKFCKSSWDSTKLGLCWSWNFLKRVLRRICDVTEVIRVFKGGCLLSFDGWTEIEKIRMWIVDLFWRTLFHFTLKREDTDKRGSVLKKTNFRIKLVKRVSKNSDLSLNWSSQALIYLYFERKEVVEKIERGGFTMAKDD